MSVANRSQHALEAGEILVCIYPNLSWVWVWDKTLPQTTNINNNQQQHNDKKEERERVYSRAHK